jgi:hypothetical protein
MKSSQGQSGTPQAVAVLSCDSTLSLLFRRVASRTRLPAREPGPCATTGLPNKTLQRTAATGIALPGREVTAVAAAAELGRSAGRA